MIFAGVVSLLSLVTLRQHLGGAAGANAAALVTTSASHVAVYNWTFLLGQSLMPAINALLLGTLLYRSRLVPRVLPVLGLSEPPAPHRRHRNAVRRHRPDLLGLARYTPGSCLGALAGHLARRQRLQALPHHGWNGAADTPPASRDATV